jgi:hypothetical protein
MDPTDTLHSIICVLYSPEAEDLGQIPENALHRIRSALDGVTTGEIVRSPIGIVLLIFYYGAYREVRLEHGAAVAAYELGKMFEQHVDLIPVFEQNVTDYTLNS